MPGTYAVRILKVEPRKNDAGKTISYRVRWLVDGETFRETFKTGAHADAFRSELMTAAKRGEAFDCETGLPAGSVRKDPGPTWFAFAMTYVDHKWPYASGNHHRGICEALTDATEVLLDDHSGAPRREELRPAMLWACSTRAQDPAAEPPAELARTVAWLADHTIRMTDFAEPKTGPALARALLDRISRLQDGRLASAHTSGRKRSILNNLMEFAVECSILPTNPLRGVKWARRKISEQVDIRTVVNTEQARRLLGAVGKLPNAGPRLVAFFGCMYYAALRPEEVIGLDHAALVSLPRTGWGEMLLSNAEPEPGKRWTENGTVRERRGLKHRAEGSTRPVPLHPELVTLLRDHLERFPTGTAHVFRGPRGGAISDSVYLPYFHRARAAAFTPIEAASPLAAVPYALRHAAVSTWLSAGVPPTQVALWAGHSVEVLYRVYAGCIAGQDTESKRRILEATSPGAGDSGDTAGGDGPDGAAADDSGATGP